MKYQVIAVLKFRDLIHVYDESYPVLNNYRVHSQGYLCWNLPSDNSFKNNYVQLFISVSTHQLCLKHLMISIY